MISRKLLGKLFTLLATFHKPFGPTSLNMDDILNESNCTSIGKILIRNRTVDNFHRRYLSVNLY